jgi:dTDP-4-amino-4,6-dideoxygalactose transaminase
MNSSDTCQPPFLTFGAPSIEEEDIDEVVQCLRSGWLGTGPRVARFEAEFATHCRVRPTQVAAVNSCTAALHVSMLAAGIEPGGEVITTPLTFCATVNAILHAGLQPVLADVDKETQNIAPAAVEAAITPRTRAILPVHFAGRPCQMDAIMAIAHKYDLVVIEDCAHAVEASYLGRPVGTFGHFGCFSFYVTKNVVTGEGGMIVGRSEEQIARARVLALHGMSKDAWHRFGDSGYKHYQVVECGFKYNMMDIQAALGLHQLRRVARNWQRRNQIWQRYDAAFADLPIILPVPESAESLHGRHLYTVIIDPVRCGVTRDNFLHAMNEARVGTGVHYLSIAEHPYYQHRFGWRADQWPHAMKLGRETVSLPLSAAMSDGDVERVIDSVTAIVRRL